ncbi:MAG: response regulator transcription factor [Gammaproteobacteria bacterium]
MQYSGERELTIKVLLAEDHVVVRDGLRVLLESEPDIRVTGCAGNGMEAVNEAVRLKPDVIVMDIAMPEGDGIEATRQVRKQCPDTQVLILSMYLNAEYVYRALRAGALGYLLKESAGEKVVEAIREVFAGRRFLSDKITEVMIDGYLNDSSDPLIKLSKREREVLQMVVEGQKIVHIAQVLSLSPKTVETYRARLMQKLGISDTVELVKFAIRHGLIV